MADKEKKDALMSHTATQKSQKTAEVGRLPLKHMKKKPGLKLTTDRVKSIGSLTPCSSPSEGPMFSSAIGPDWKAIEIEVSQAFEVKKEAN